MHALLSRFDQLTMTRSAGKLHGRENKGKYSLVLVILWILIMIGFGSDWSTESDAFVHNNDSLEDIFTRINVDASRFWYIPSLMATAISNGILVRISVSAQGNS